MKLKLLAILITFFGWVPSIGATTITLSIPPSFAATPGVALQILATITNETGSTITFANIDERIYFSNGNLIFNPENGDTFAGAGESFPNNQYYSLVSYTFGPTTNNSSLPFQEQFNDVVIAPDNSFSFVAATILLDPSIPVGLTLSPFYYVFETITYNPGPPIYVVSNGAEFSLDIVSAATPLPTALPLFATGLGGLGLLGWRRKRKAAQSRCRFLSRPPNRGGAASRLRQRVKGNRHYKAERRFRLAGLRFQANVKK